MRNKLIAGALTMVIAGANCAVPTFANESGVYTPTVVFEETFPGADGTDLVNSDANKADDNYFSDGFKFINDVQYSADKTNRFGIINEALPGRNAIKRLSGQPMTTLQSIYKPLKNTIDMNPAAKTIYYIKWSEYIQDQSPDDVARYGGFQGMAEKPTQTGYDACMIDFANSRVGAGIGNNGGKKMSAFVSYGLENAPHWDEAALNENTWYDMVLRIEANPTGTNDSMSLKVYETGTTPTGGFGAVAEYASDKVYDKLSYYFKAIYCTRTAANGKSASDMAISASRAERFGDEGADAVAAAENAVLTLEKAPTLANKAAAESLIKQIDASSLAYALLNSRASVVEVTSEAELQSVRISGNTDVIGATVFAETVFGEGPKPSVDYQWYRDGVEISGANSTAYKITAEDREKTITVSAASGGITKTSDGRTVSDDATVLADETIIESNIGVSNFDSGFSTGWRIIGDNQKLSSSKEIGAKASISNNMISFNVSASAADKYVRGLAAPIYTNSDNVYYLTWVQDALSLDNYKNSNTFQKVEFGEAEGDASNLVLGTLCTKGASVQRFKGLYKRDDLQNTPEVYIYPYEKYRVVVRIDASSEAGGDSVYYKMFKENNLVNEQAEWSGSDEGITIAAECLDKILVQSSITDGNNFGALKIERYPAADIKNIDLALAENEENAASLIAALPDGLAKNDLLSKLNAKNKKTGVQLIADKDKLQTDGNSEINITLCNYDEKYYKDANVIVAEYSDDGVLLKAEVRNTPIMQEQILNDTITISAGAGMAKLLLLESVDTIKPLDKCVVLQRQ